MIASAAVAVVAAATPASLCGNSLAEPPYASGDWSAYECMSRSRAGERWGWCLSRSEYTDQRGAGCPGRERCCPPDESRAFGASTAADDDSGGVAWLAAALGFAWFVWPAMFFGILYAIIGIFAGGSGRAFLYAIAGGIVAVVGTVLAFGVAAALFGASASGAGGFVGGAIGLLSARRRRRDAEMAEMLGQREAG